MHARKSRMACADAGPNPQSTAAAESLSIGERPHEPHPLVLRYPGTALISERFLSSVACCPESECLPCLPFRYEVLVLIRLSTLSSVQSQHRPEVKGKICNKPSQMEFSRHQRTTDGAETVDRCCPLKVQLARASTNRSPINPKSTRPLSQLGVWREYEGI
jgi:hypothetical protein